MPIAQGVTLPETVRSVDIDAPVDVVFQTITDFESYPQFLSDVVAVARVRDGDPAGSDQPAGAAATDSATASPAEPPSQVVEFALSVVKKFAYQLRVTSSAPWRVDWELVEGSLFTSNTGGWLLEALDDGRRTRATYRVALSLALFVPRAVRNRLTSIILPEVLDRFRREAERRARPPETPATAEAI